MRHRATIFDALLVLFWIAAFLVGWVWGDPFNLPPIDPLGAFP